MYVASIAFIYVCFNTYPRQFAGEDNKTLPDRETMSSLPISFGILATNTGICVLYFVIIQYRLVEDERRMIFPFDTRDHAGNLRFVAAQTRTSVR